LLSSSGTVGLDEERIDDVFGEAVGIMLVDPHFKTRVGLGMVGLGVVGSCSDLGRGDGAGREFGGGEAGRKDAGVVGEYGGIWGEVSTEDGATDRETERKAGEGGVDVGMVVLGGELGLSYTGCPACGD